MVKFAQRMRLRLCRMIGAMLILFLMTTGALADGVMPSMPEPPEKPIFWQLTRIEQIPDVAKSGGYGVTFDVTGLDIDLSDALMAEALLEAADAPVPKVRLTIRRGDNVMEHAYTWTALPIFLAKNSEYEIALTASETSAPAGKTPNSLLSAAFQGESRLRISAGGYSGHQSEGTLVFSTAKGVYEDGTFAITMTIRDVNEMFQFRAKYTYEMMNGIKPVPTPAPGFIAHTVPRDAVPSFYEAVPGKSGLYRIITAPSQFRAYGEVSGSRPMFFPADAEGNVEMNAKPVSDAGDFANFVQGFYPETPDAVPPEYRVIEEGVYGFTARDGQTLFRAYGRLDGEEPAFYPYDPLGRIEPSAGPLVPADDYAENVSGFGPAMPQETVPFYVLAGPGQYTFADRQGKTHYRMYGRLNGQEPAYYETDKNWQLAEGGAAISPDDDFATHIQGFDAVLPEQLPAFYQDMGDGQYAIVDRYGQAHHRVYGVLDGAEPAFYPANALGEIMADEDPIVPDEDYDDLIAGFISTKITESIPAFYRNTDVPGVYTFTDKSGTVRYRTFGQLDGGALAFYPCDEQGDVARGALPIDPASDLTALPSPAFVAKAPSDPPTFYEAMQGREGLFAFVGRDGQEELRVYGGFGADMPHYYAADASGRPIAGTEPVNPHQDFIDHIEGFEKIAADPAPEQYHAVEGTEGLYTFDAPGGAIYRVYGSLDRQEPQFYALDDEGNPADVIDPSLDIPVMPTPYAAVIATPVPRGEGAAAVSRDVQALPEATFYARAVQEMQAVDGSGGTIVRVQAAQPEAMATQQTSHVVSTEAPADSVQTIARQAATVAAQGSDALSTGEPKTEQTSGQPVDGVDAKDADASPTGSAGPADGTDPADGKPEDSKTQVPPAEETPAVTEVEDVTQAPSEDVKPEPTGNVDAQPEESSGSNTVVIAGIVAAVVILGAGGLMFRARRKK